MEFKAGVNVEGVVPEMWYALGVAEAEHRGSTSMGIVVTSLRDGEHMKGSLHYQGRAADIRTRDLSAKLSGFFAEDVAAILRPLGFDVVLETDPPHLHIEYDPKGARMFPAVPATERAAAPGEVGNG